MHDTLDDGDSQGLGADLTFAWPTAEIAVMGAEAATAIIHRSEIQAAADPRAKEQERYAKDLLLQTHNWSNR